MLVSRQPKRRTPRGYAGALFFAAVVSLGLLVAQFARVGHLVFVSHSLCEHGALVHGHHEEAHRHAPQGRDAAATPGDALEDSGHDHCEPFAVQSFAVSVGPSCVVPTVLDAELLPWSVRPRPGERSIPLLSLAPKSSPPV